MRLTFIGLCSLSLLAACRGDSNKNPDGSTDTGGGTHIQDVQNDSMAPGTPVELHGVIVTAIDTFGTKTGNVWVEEPDGGPFSGVLVFGLPVTQITSLTAGDIVDLTNTIKDEFAIGGDTSGRTVTELDARMGTISKSGTGTVPMPSTVDALAIGQKATQADRDMEWEKWEGVLITVTNVTAFGAPACITSMGMCPDKTFESFSATGVVKIESQIANFPKDTTPMMLDTIKSGDCLASVTGIGDYAFDYLIQARSTAEIVTGGTGCAPREGTAPAVCTNGIDDDGNGFSDCADNGCIVGEATCRALTTITAIQATTPTGPIELDNVYVTGIAHNKRAFWASTNPAAAVNEGVYIFNPNTLDVAVVPGSKVTIIGKVSEFNDDTMGGTLTEVAPLSLVFDNTAPATIAPIAGKTAAQLLDAGTAPTYESILVTLTNVNITTLGMTANGFIATAVQGGTTFKVGTDIIQLTAAQMGCYTSITGYWTNLEAPATGATTKPNAFGFIPLTLGALGGTCN